MPRGEAIAYYRGLFDGKLERKPNHVWNTLALNIGAFPAPELLEPLRHAYDEKLVETFFMRLEDVEADLNDPSLHKADRTFITDAIIEMERGAARLERT